MSEFGEPKTGAPAPFELDARGVEILPFDDTYRTPYDGRILTINLDGVSRRAHRLPPNFRANMNMYLKFMDARSPAGLYEQIALKHFQANGIKSTLEHMADEVPNLFGNFVEEYQIWRRLKEITSRQQPVTREDVEFKRIADRLDADTDRQGRRILYESSAYAYLAPKVKAAGPAVLYT